MTIGKILMSVAFITAIGSCKKNSGKTCWDCTVDRRDGTQYQERVCRDDNFIPQFQDNLGNDLNAFCTKR